MNESRIIELFKAIYAAELETVENHLAGPVWLEGTGAQQVAESSTPLPPRIQIMLQ